MLASFSIPLEHSTFINKLSEITTEVCVYIDIINWFTGILFRHSSVCSMEREEDKSSLTPLHWAMFYDHVEHLKLLLPR